MAGTLTSTGSGRISPPDGSLDSWTVSEAVVSGAIGSDSPATGGVSFSGTRDETDGNYSEWMINNPATFTHTDDGGGSDLGEVTGVISEMTVQVSGASGSMASDLARLNAIRTADPIAEGVYTGYWDLANPSGTISLGAVRDSSGNLNVLTDYGPTGTVYVYDREGSLLSTWTPTGSASPVSIGTDTAGFFYIGQTSGVPGLSIRVYNTAHTYVRTIGSSGTGNGQFQRITAIGNDSSGNTYVLDSTQYRVTKFNNSGVYQLKWGSQTTANTGWISPTDLSVTTAGTVAVSDAFGAAEGGGMVKVYNSSGVFSYLISTDLTAPNAVQWTSGSDLAIVDLYGLTAWDSVGTASARRSSFTPWPIDVYPVGALVPSTYTNGSSDVFFVEESYVVGAPKRIIRFFGFSIGPTLGEIYEYYLWLIEDVLPVPNFSYTGTYQYQSGETYSDSCLYGYVGWRDSVWTKLNELAVATSTEIAVVGGVRTVRDIASTDQAVTSWVVPPALSVGSLGTAQSLNVVYQNASRSGSFMYDARADNNRVFSVQSGAVEVFTVATGSYPTYLEDPVAYDSLSAFLAYGFSAYMVSGSDNLPVVAAQWTSYGGDVAISVGDNPGDILLTLTGPTSEIPGVPGPYSLSVSDGSTSYATFKAYGQGVSATPKTLVRHTAADPAKVTQTSQTTITNVFINTKADAYRASSWAASYAGGPVLTGSATLPIADCQGFGVTSGSIFPYNDSVWRIRTASIQNAQLAITFDQWTTCADHILVWGAQTAGTYATFWDGEPSENAIVMPLRS